MITDPGNALKIGLLEKPQSQLDFRLFASSHKARWRLYPACSWRQWTESCSPVKLIRESKVRAAFSPAIAPSSRIVFFLHCGHPCLLTLWQPWKLYHLFLHLYYCELNWNPLCLHMYKVCVWRLGKVIFCHYQEVVQECFDTNLFKHHCYYQCPPHQVMLFSKYATVSSSSS